MKIGIFCLPGLEGVLKDIVPFLSNKYEVRTCYSKSERDVLEVLEWCDTVWINWANELAVYMTTNPKTVPYMDKRRVIVRLHSYETLHGYVPQINWNIVSEIIFVAEHVRAHALSQIEVIPPETYVVPNGVDIKKFNLGNNVGKGGLNIACLAYMSHKKGPMLLLQAFKELCKLDTFVLHIGGVWQEERFRCYWEHMVKEMKFGEDRIQFHNWIERPEEWLKNMDYIICTSPWEGHPVGIMQGMSCGCMPLIHNWPGANTIFDTRYTWNTISELGTMVVQNSFTQDSHQKFLIDKGYTLENQLSKINKILSNNEKYNLDNQFLNMFATIQDNIEADIIVKGNCSCVIPVKNGMKTIRETIESLQNQEGTRLQKIVVVDDCSTDNTVALVKTIISEYELKPGYVPIELVRNSHTLWHYQSRNVGSQFVNTDYIFFLDADDMVTPTYCEILCDMLDKNPTSPIAYCNIQYTNENSQLGDISNVPIYDEQTLINGNFIAYSSMLRKSIFDSVVGYDTYLNDCWNHASERDLWFRMIESSTGIPEVCTGALFQYRIHSQQQSKKHKRGRADQQFQMFYRNTTILGDVCPDEYRPEKSKDPVILFVHKARDPRKTDEPAFEMWTFIKSLENYGRVYCFAYDIDMGYYGQDEMNSNLLDYANEINPDIIFHCTYKNHIKGQTWEELSKKFNTVAWNSDDTWKFDRLKDYCKNFRHVITTYESAAKKWNKLSDLLVSEGKEGFQTHLTQWAANPAYLYWSSKVTRDIDISFCGTNYSNRKEIIDWIRSEFDYLNIECYGPGWENSLLPFPQMADVYRRSKVVLNFANGADDLPQLKLRVFEATACGALCLTEPMPELDRYFTYSNMVDEKNTSMLCAGYDEIVVFQNREHLKFCLRNLFVKKKDRISPIQEISANGLRRTINQHCWDNRFDPIFKGVKRITNSTVPPGGASLKHSTTTIYNSQFYEKHSKYEKVYEIISQIMENNFNIDSVIDWGCGTGQLLAALKTKEGNNNIFGIEGSESAKPFLDKNLGEDLWMFNSVIAPNHTFDHRLDGSIFSLAVCMEVAEHIDKGNVHQLVSNISNIGEPEYIWWTAAQPGQGGVGHINCQSISYWEDVFSGEDYHSDWELTYKIKCEMFAYDHNLFSAYPWFRDNLVIFKYPNTK